MRSQLSPAQQPLEMQLAPLLPQPPLVLLPPLLLPLEALWLLLATVEVLWVD